MALKNLRPYVISMVLMSTCFLNAQARLDVQLLGPTSPPKNLNDNSQGNISGLDRSTVTGTYAHACYAFPRYVVRTEVDFTKPDHASFTTEPIASTFADGIAQCQQSPQKNKLSFLGHFTGFAGDYIFSSDYGPNPPHENRLTIYDAMSGKVLWMTECELGKMMEVKDGHLLRYWKEEARVLPENCPTMNTSSIPSALLMILNRHVEVDLRTLVERPLSETVCTDPRPEDL